MFNDCDPLKAVPTAAEHLEVTADIGKELRHNLLGFNSGTCEYTIKFVADGGVPIPDPAIATIEQPDRATDSAVLVVNFPEDFAQFFNVKN